MIRLLCLLSCLWAASLSAAPLTLIPLQHRLPEQVIPSLSPLLGPDEKLLAVGDQLGVLASQETLSQVQQLLGQLDRPLHRLQISLRSGQQMMSEERGVEVQGQLGLGEAASRLQAQLRDTQQQGQRQLMQQVQTVEGGRAQLYVGQSYPMAMNTYLLENGHWVAQPGWQYVDLASGFTAQAQLRGEQVLVTVAPQLQQPSGQGIASTRLQTELQGPLGQWLPLGSSQEQGSAQQQGLAPGRQQGQQSVQLWLKVERLD